MVANYIRVVEYPKGIILEIEELSEVGLMDILGQIDDFREEIEDRINKIRGDD